MTPLRLRADVATTETEDGMVLLDRRTGRYWVLNRTGALVVRGLTAGLSHDEIAEELAGEQHRDAGQALAEVRALAEQLRNAQLAHT
ncbi:lasso peptide biosynthesis PqqD family chaperone [Actinoalloteichus spitiensis]|uniref:lasso peptide biosynthesis PqqD family chaperone n=1 Tax=Actinoalloteichus spitiensis TaxID=252394 RepID=UPI000360C93C|nr:lasso peptide biosynthesis PqqD family chaperone [Actinoalloteichus spitiensis]